MSLQEFWHHLTGPRLYRIFRFRDQPGRPYAANRVEIYSDIVVRVISVMSSVAIYSSPIIIGYLWRKGWVSTANPYAVLNPSIMRFAIIFTFAYVGALVVRGIGRSANREYKGFATILTKAKQKDDMSRLALSRFEFDFNHWPIDFRWYESTFTDPKKPPELVVTGRHSKRNIMIAIPCDLLSYVLVHTIARRMLYPGSVGLLNLAVSQAMLEGRTKLVEENNGERYKLLARDGNQIDTMFVDRRNRNTTKGKTLVICSEGNAGFYEFGTMGTPLDIGYSVLGWNHPGFGGSTGLPYPQNVINAMDVVIRFAIERLGFPLNSVLLHGWSIGGFPVSWAAQSYQQVKGLVLDASFDDVLPLAENAMPPALNPIVRNLIRTYFNLNISENINRFNGPILLIRRLRDEIISTNRLEQLRSNRGNDMLYKLLSNRFPVLMASDEIKKTLASWLLANPADQATLMMRYGVTDELCLNQLLTYMKENGVDYPLNIGDNIDMTIDMKIKLVLFLAKKHMKHYDSTHCTPLPAILFEEPFDLLTIFNNKIKSSL
ncbi:phosphatidylserine lipase ABHD16A-like [Oppia nitens]|uniref:phosphatidylserine lipase ABHD16A-like n=1 Tax=Oppia nitens TaxID=1686743 RepID=UPI0023D9F314|nr:phosphatidylserine lipase ABHD16A-like [Oppia nitens]